MKKLFLDTVEKPIEGSPTITLKSGNTCIPQHFYTFNHSIDSVKKLIKRVSFSSYFNPYIFEKDDSICLQIEIIGHENYHYKKNQKREVKKVYGRKWRIEKNLPTSEIIQTTMLAIKKAIEHEVRELFKIENSELHFTTSPLNNHQDLPLICSEYIFLESREDELSESHIQKLFKSIRFNSQTIKHTSIKPHNDLYIIDIEFSTSNTNPTEINFS